MRAVEAIGNPSRLDDEPQLTSMRAPRKTLAKAFQTSVGDRPVSSTNCMQTRVPSLESRRSRIVLQTPTFYRPRRIVA